MPLGRKPKATALKEQSGAYKRNPQRRNHDEPKVNTDSPEPTEEVKTDPIALAKFHHVVSLLEEMRVISTVDSDLIAKYSIVYSEIMENVLKMRNEGQIVDGARGGKVRNPRTVILSALRNQQLKMLAEMGLTPSSRTRLKAAPKEEDDILAKLIKKRESLN